MSKITYNAELLKLMTLFESVTRTRLKDCFYDNNEHLTFVVNQQDIGKAIGKHAANVKRLENMLKKKIKVLAFNPTVEQFVRNLAYPMVPDQVELKDDTIIIRSQDTKTKAFIIGRNRSNLNNMQNILNKYFKDIKTIKVE